MLAGFLSKVQVHFHRRGRARSSRGPARLVLSRGSSEFIPPSGALAQSRSRSCPPTSGRHSAMDTGMDAHEEDCAWPGDDGGITGQRGVSGASKRGGEGHARLRGHAEAEARGCRFRKSTAPEGLRASAMASMFAFGTALEADSPFGSVLDASPASTAAPESEGHALQCQCSADCSKLPESEPSLAELGRCEYHLSFTCIA